jgi:large subunit ribosomal protein L4
MLINEIVQFKVKNLSGQKEETISTLRLKVQNQKGTYLIHRALIKQLIENRKGNANTKTRSEVKGGGRKPWKQKGTGKARCGSNRSPLWKGGGVTFGPQKKNYQIKLNKKEWRVSLQTLLFNKKDCIVVIKDLYESFENITKTKIFLNYIKDLNTITDIQKNKKILIILPSKPKSLISSIQNLKNINVVLANSLNIKSLLDSNCILTSPESLKIIEETYGK